eukprot:CAMPEP_0180391516 /NCGR_PEP_ID=MMETSP0989-20121125/32629_1 /TAXON_ID=697907 /ORGANISM="non described non described, Strain CCMP2293" /LENGTH=166 /DNA_ID=CAMNT_0022393081 /DNA_START=46 /DNA_END=543 /DNA_ORIENTATION=+
MLKAPSVVHFSPRGSCPLHLGAQALKPIRKHVAAQAPQAPHHRFPPGVNRRVAAPPMRATTHARSLPRDSQPQISRLAASLVVRVRVRPAVEVVVELAEPPGARGVLLGERARARHLPEGGGRLNGGIGSEKRWIRGTGSGPNGECSAWGESSGVHGGARYVARCA